jgi:dolichyl-phosphate-mannose--protein O-mannosyl transferase
VDGEKLGNKVDNYKTPLNINGIRFFPKVFGSLVPILIFLITYEIIGRNRRKAVLDIGRATWKQIVGELLSPKYSVPLLTGMFAALENSFILESRYALLSQILIFFMLYLYI